MMHCFRCSDVHKSADWTYQQEKKLYAVATCTLQSSLEPQQFSVEVPPNVESMFPPGLDDLNVQEWFGAVLGCGQENVRDFKFSRAELLSKFP